MMNRAISPFISLALVACAWLLYPSVLFAKPAHKKALADYLGPFLAKKLNDCRACHLPAQPGEDEDQPHNPFGARLKAIRKELVKTGKPNDLAACLDAIAEEDSDGDGVSNLIELLAGRFPGDGDDRPTAAEVDAARQKLPAFRKFRSSYPWRPFQVVNRPAVPPVKNTAWVRNPIDAFIAAEHEEHGLQARPEAPRHVLVRRIYLDLIGLPPTREELEAALRDTSPEWFERIVDRLLASSQYGERWGRHWMDVWRYSESYSLGVLYNSQPHIWRWRDWIIESLNEDKGYDRMVMEMLAGDELAPDDAKVVRATGYLARSANFFREEWMKTTVDHTFQAFLGVRLGCARCHDHMYDPIKQVEYYRVRAFFDPLAVRIDQLPGKDLTKDGFLRVFDKTPEVKTYLYQLGDDRRPDKTPLIPGVPEALGGKLPEIEPVKLPFAVFAPGKRLFAVEQRLAASEAALARPREGLAKARQGAALAVAQSLADNGLAVAARLMGGHRTWDTLALAEVDVQTAEARHDLLAASVRAEVLDDAGKKETEDWKLAATQANAALRRIAVLQARRNVLTTRQALRTATSAQGEGLLKQLAGAEMALAKAELDAVAPPATTYPKGQLIESYPKFSTGRRLALARWIAGAENPLTARVAMNHIWLRHFGQALVPSVFDFGRNGQPPSHPALLDWLAAEFMAQGWSMKHAHRLLVTSSTYRQASTTDAATLAIDRDNRYYWRMASRRMEAEVVRDSIFHVAGTLDLTLGGPALPHQQGLTIPRRSLYFHHAAGVKGRMELLTLFDGSDPSDCYMRNESIRPHQALALLNSELTIRQARLLARKLTTQVGSDSTAFVKATYEQVLGHAPSREDLADCLSFLEQETQRLAKEKPTPPARQGTDDLPPSPDPSVRARENLVHVLFNHHDFVTIR